MRSLQIGSFPRETAALLIALAFIPAYAVAILYDLYSGTSDWIVRTSGVFLVYIFVLGMAVMLSMRRKAVIGARRWLIWMLLYGILIGFILVIYEYAFPNSEFVNIIIDDPDALTLIFQGLALGMVMFLSGLVMVLFAFSSIWLMEKVLTRVLPWYLKGVRDADLGRRGGWLGRLECWLVDVPDVLDPGTLTFDPGEARRKSTKRRWAEVLFWQLILGLLLAVYISLNPVLLNEMDYVQIFILVIYVAFMVPFLILPWSTLESLGAKMKGVRKDFYLHDGARSRLLQTVVALGTIVLMVRIALTEVGADLILSSFSLYFIGLVSLSGLVSFIYFNYFERGLIPALLESLDVGGRDQSGRYP